jgi:hypothetical protein
MAEVFNFHNLKGQLMKIASQLIDYKEKDLEGDIDIGDFFDCISYHIYGAASFGPKEQMEKEVLEHNRDHSGRDFLNSFLTLVIQSGVKLGHLEKEKAFEELQEKYDSHKERTDRWLDGYQKQVEDLTHKKMPEGTLEDEIVSLRKQLDEEKLKNAKLQRYKGLVEDIVKRASYLEPKDSDN